MNNKIYENYVSVFESIKTIISQNNSVSYNVETITTDSEEALIMSINECFPETQRIGCYYHYINDINRNAKLHNIFSDSNYHNFFKEISKIPLIYKGDMKSFDKLTDELKRKYPKFENYINNYFIKNKRRYFVSKDFDYYHIPEDSRSNSYLESYNKYIKNNLGENRIVNWFNFVNFLKNESKRIKSKLYSNDAQNIKFSQKKTKFGYTKYNNISKNKNKNKDNNNIINWIKYKTNSCRYDSFLTLFSIVIDNQYLDMGIDSNYKLNRTCNALLKDPESELRFVFWKYLTENNYDIDNSIANENNFRKMGVISQLFSILNNNNHFCILEKKILSCNKCNKEFTNLIHYRSPLISISSTELEYSDITTIFIDKKYTDGVEFCPDCANNRFKIKTCSIKYDIEEMPKYLLFILDIDESELLSLSANILNIFKDEIKIDIKENNINQIKYEFISTICYKNENHFTIGFQKIAQNISNNKLKNDVFYYHDGIEKNGIIQEIKDVNELYILKNAYPYLFIYEKKD